MDNIKNKNKNKNKNKDIFLKLQYIYEYFSSKLNSETKTTEEEKKDENEKTENIINEEKKNTKIYIDYLKNPNIIFQNKEDNNNENLKLIFNELNNDIDNGHNIILPFLDVVPNLVKAYIESNLDNNEEGEIPSELINESNESLYQKVFKKLKNNCFISKEVIVYIYEYFSNLYDKVKEMKEEDDLSKKLYKMMSLFKIFYEKKSNKNQSSICVIGDNLRISFNEILKLSDIKLTIEIYFLNIYLDNINQESYIFEINNIKKNYAGVLNNIFGQKLIYINITICNKNIYLHAKSDKKYFKMSTVFNFDELEEINILENFYGQLSLIEVSLEKSNNKIEYSFYPISIRNENNIYYYKKIIHNEENTNDLKNIIPIIKINNKNLVKINYLNYNEKLFDIIDYFGGVIQFLPFYYIIKTLKEKNINNINLNNLKMSDSSLNESLNITKENMGKKENEIINKFVIFIIRIIVKKFFSIKDKIKQFKKNIIFIFSLILDLDIDFTENILDNFNNKNNIIYDYVEFLNEILMSKKNYIDIKNELASGLQHNGKKLDINFFKMPQKSFNQLYKEYMKKLFIFNNLWSKKNIFFKKDKTREIKYKQINYYTKNYQLPYFYPILELSNYYPKFSKLKEGIFRGLDENVFEYDFKLEIKSNNKDNYILNIISVQKSKKTNDISEKCCLVKSCYHVQGKLFLIKNNESKKKKFELIFKPKEENDIDEKCNKNDLVKQKQDIKLDISKMNNLKMKESLCYGSIFKCLPKEYNRNTIIKSKDILFLLIRVYFHRVSAIEIFTINKSYYFNFQNQFEINNIIKKNKILCEIKSYSFFKEIKIKNKEKFTLGFYNTLYESYLFPLFREEIINNWDKRIKYLCNYDILILINIFSNRSFRDVYQYPVFPMLYNWINEKRNMEEHIGFQEITESCKKRKNDIIVCYNTNDDGESNDENNFLFNIHFSNPAFVFNYLLRVIPYSFLAVEFQGDDFDNPNRCFFSIEKCLNSTLKMKSDLRELIPELFYMIEIFYNKNKLYFDELYDGSNIDYVEILSKDGTNPQTIIEKRLNMAKFLYEIRKALEDENNLDSWINLIFGSKQKGCIINDKKYYYFEETSETLFKNDPKILNDSLTMDYVDFGLVPYQLFNKDFVKKEIISENKNEELKKLNIELFNEGYIDQIFSPIECFICKGTTLMNNNYIKIIDPKEQINILDSFEIPIKYIQTIDINSLNESIFQNTFGSINITSNCSKDISKNLSSLINYYFIGDIYGTVYIYSLVKSKKEKNEEEEEEEEEESEKLEFCGSLELEDSQDNISFKKAQNLEKRKEFFNSKKKGSTIPILRNKKPISQIILKLVKKFNDHSKEIKFIEFNPRLNILLTYSLDNYINIYIFPQFKLINVIDTNSFKEKNDLNCFIKVVAISYPFPMIVCYNKQYIYLLSINGEIIKNKKLEKNHSISFYIDKNLGLFRDLVEINDDKGVDQFNYI